MSWMSLRQAASIGISPPQRGKNSGKTSWIGAPDVSLRIKNAGFPRRLVSLYFPFGNQAIASYRGSVRNSG